MDNEIPTPAKGVYIYFDYIALGFVLAAVEEIYRGSSWKVWVGALVLGAVFLSLGIMGPKMKNALVARLPWVRTKRELRSALMEIQELRKNQLAAPAALVATQREDPDLRVDYKRASSGQRAVLEFRVRSGAPVTIQKVGAVISEEKYRSESEFVLLQSVIPEAETDRPVACEISCVKNSISGNLTALEDLLESGSPGVSDSVLIEFSADGQQYSRRFFLHKNADGGIVWSTNPTHQESRDLGPLRNTLHSLRSAIDDLTFVGRLAALEQTSLSLESQLTEILDSASTEGLDLSHPFRREIWTNRRLYFLHGSDVD